MEFTEEQIEKINKAFQDSLIKVEIQRDAKCAEGIHGFNVETWCNSAGIHSRCKNCGEQWGTSPMPFIGGTHNATT
jgi:hypothetical protein